MNNLQKLLLTSTVISIFGLNLNPALAQLTPREERAAECLGYAIGALITGDNSNLCDENIEEPKYQYQNEQYYHNEVDREYIRQQELNDYIRQQDLKRRQIERRNEWLIHDDGVCLSCSNY